MIYDKPTLSMFKSRVSGKCSPVLHCLFPNHYRIETYIDPHCTLSEMILLTISVIHTCSSRYHDFTRPESVAQCVTNLLPKSLLICYDSSRIKTPVTEFRNTPVTQDGDLAAICKIGQIAADRRRVVVRSHRAPWQHCRSQ